MTDGPSRLETPSACAVSVVHRASARPSNHRRRRVTVSERARLRGRDVSRASQPAGPVSAPKGFTPEDRLRCSASSLRPIGSAHSPILRPAPTPSRRRPGRNISRPRFETGAGGGRPDAARLRCLATCRHYLKITPTGSAACNLPAARRMGRVLTFPAPSGGLIELRGPNWSVASL